MTAVALAPEPGAEESRRIVARFQAGDTGAYADIYRRYRDYIYAFINKRVGNHHLAEDLTHDTFVRGLRYLGRWEYRDKDIRAWLVTIARNLVVDHVKSAHTRLDVTTDDVFGADPADHSREANPESAVIGHLRDLALLRALAHLSEDQRTCIVHRFVQQLSVAETAALMGRNEPAVKSLQLRALAALARMAAYERAQTS